MTESDDNAAHSEATSALASAYEQFRDHVIPLAGDIALSVPGYTDHSINHCDALWETASMLTDSDFQLNPAEAFVLGGAFLVHDLGMGLPAYSEGLAEITASVEWLDLLAMEFPEDHQEIQRAIQADIAKDSTWNGLTDARSKAALTYFLRLNHARQAEEIVDRHWKLSSGQEFYLIPDTRLRFFYAKLIGKLGRSHWVDVNELPEMFPKSYGAPPGYPINWTIDPIKLACLLRLADATQVDARRADPLHTPHRDPQGISRDHWVFQEHLLTPQVVSSRLMYTSAAPLPAEQAEAWWLAFDTAVLIDNELRKVDALCGDLSKPRFTANSVAGAESPDRFAAFVPPSGWWPVDARPHISDSTQVISSLGGANLYGGHITERQVFIRELIANALDATRARRFGVSPTGIKPIEITLTSDEAHDQFIIRDYGVGMNEDVIVNNLCDFGRSGWRKKNMADRFPGIMANDFTPTGRFGIGFFSVFMVADVVRVVSRPIEGGWDDTIQVEFFGGLHNRPIVTKARGRDRLAEAGTEIYVTLRKRFNEDGGIFELAPSKDIEDATMMCASIRSLALMADEDISIRAVGSTEYVTAIRRNEWLEMSGEELFDAMNGTNQRLIPSEALSALRSTFSRNVAPISDSTGKVVGKLGLQIDFRDYHYYYRIANTSAVYCGGLAAERGSNYLGIIGGEATRARRDQVRVKLTLEDFQRWFTTQRGLIDAAELAIEEAIALQGEGLRLGIRSDDLPIVCGESGYITPLQFMDYCRDLDEVFIIDSFPEALKIGEQNHWGCRSEAENRFCLPTHAQFLGDTTGTIYFPEEELLPFRGNEYAKKWKGRSRTSPNFDPVAWWSFNFASCLGELLRLLGECWDIEPSKLIEGMTQCAHRSDGADTRLMVSCLGGGEAPLDAIRISRKK